jgi:hypothetical protein
MNTGKKMESNSLSNVCGNFQELRDMWSSKAQTKEKPLRPTSIPSCPHPEKRQEQKKPLKGGLPILKITNDATPIAPIKKESPTTPNNESKAFYYNKVNSLRSIISGLKQPYNGELRLKTAAIYCGHLQHW